MFNKIINSVKDLNYVKVSKANWKRIEDLFASKERTISEQSKLASDRLDTIRIQEAELEELRKYKANDDMVFSYEQSNKKLRDENKAIRRELEGLAEAIGKADKKVQSVLCLESAYLQRIIQAESKARYCPQYEVKGDSLIEFYA